MVSILFMTIISSLCWVFLVNCYHTKDQKSLSELVLIGLMGGAFSSQFAWVLNISFTDITQVKICQLNHTKPIDTFIAAYYVGFNEEAWKLIAIFILLAWIRSRASSALNIMTLGISVSLGFAFWENISYGVDFGWEIVLFRSLIPGHLVYGAILSVGLSESRRGQKKGYDLIWIVLCYLLASIYHATYDFFIFLDIYWGFVMALILAWLPIIIFHRYLRTLGKLNIPKLQPIRSK